MRLFLFQLLTTIMMTMCFSANSLAGSVSIIAHSPLTAQKPNSVCDSELCQSLKTLIENAKISIDFAIYGIKGQSEIFAALVAAENRGVHVRGVLDKDVNDNNYYSDSNRLEKTLQYVRTDFDADKAAYDQIVDKIEKKRELACAAPKNTRGTVQCFEGKGYASKQKIRFKGNLMHNKFFVVDSQFVWTGSANISDTGTGGYNANIVAVIDSKELASFYTTEFDQMYEDGHFHRNKSQFKKQDIKVDINGQSLDLYFSPQGYTVRRGIIPLIHAAKESIDIAMFFLTHKSIAQELVKASQRGVSVGVLLDATGAANGYSKHHYLRENGIAVKVETWGGKMHMKTAVVDQKHVVVGSMNWTASGDSRNDENTIVLRNSPVQAKELTAFFNKLWTSVPDKSLSQDPKAESLQSGTACFDGMDNDFDRKVDEQDKGCS